MNCWDLSILAQLKKSPCDEVLHREQIVFASMRAPCTDQAGLHRAIDTRETLDQFGQAVAS